MSSDDADTQGITLTNEHLTQNARDIVNKLNNKQKKYLKSYMRSYIQSGSRILSDQELINLATERDLESLFRFLGITKNNQKDAITEINQLSHMNGGRFRKKTNRRRYKSRHNKRHIKSTRRRRHRKY
jgi:hypothetical protein